MSLLAWAGDIAAYAAGILSCLILVHQVFIAREGRSEDTLARMVRSNILFFSVLNAGAFGWIAVAVMLRNGPPSLDGGALWAKFVFLTLFSLALAHRLWVIWRGRREGRQARRAARRLAGMGGER